MMGPQELQQPLRSGLQQRCTGLPFVEPQVLLQETSQGPTDQTSRACLGPAVLSSAEMMLADAKATLEPLQGRQRRLQARKNERASQRERGRRSFRQYFYALNGEDFGNECIQTAAKVLLEMEKAGSVHDNDYGSNSGRSYSCIVRLPQGIALTKDGFRQLTGDFEVCKGGIHRYEMFPQVSALARLARRDVSSRHRGLSVSVEDARSALLQSLDAYLSNESFADFRLKVSTGYSAPMNLVHYIFGE